MTALGGLRRLPSMSAKLYRGEQQIDFPRLWKRALVFSLIAVLLSAGSLVVRRLDLGIDFNGGTAWEVQAPGVSVAETRNALRGTGAADAKIQTVGGDAIRVRSDVDGAAAVDEVRGVLADLADADSTDVSVTTVGPSWGSQVTAKARNALLAFFALVALYIAVRLEWKMAVGALAAVIHDIVISVGFYSIFGFEITPATIIAFLTIMGYSLYDTIVVYDKVREVVGRVSATGRYTYTEMMNLALNQVFMRSVNTSITSMLPVASMLFIGSFVLGAVTLQEFAIALLVGIVVGTYSSVFVAAALVTWMKEREPAYIAVAEKVRLRRGDTGLRSVAVVTDAVGRGAAAASASGEDESDAEQTSGTSYEDRVHMRPSSHGATVIPPKPRKRKKKRKKR